MKVKCGREEYDLIPKDTIMDNGAVILIVSRVTLSGKTLRMSRATFKKLLADEKLELIKEDLFMVKGGIRYYKIKKE